MILCCLLGINIHECVQNSYLNTLSFEDLLLIGFGVTRGVRHNPFMCYVFIHVDSADSNCMVQINHRVTGL